MKKKKTVENRENFVTQQEALVASLNFHVKCLFHSRLFLVFAVNSNKKNDN